MMCEQNIPPTKRSTRSSGRHEMIWFIWRKVKSLVGAPEDGDSMKWIRWFVAAVVAIIAWYITTYPDVDPEKILQPLPSGPAIVFKNHYGVPVARYVVPRANGAASWMFLDARACDVEGDRRREAVLLVAPEEAVANARVVVVKASRWFPLCYLKRPVVEFDPIPDSVSSV